MHELQVIQKMNDSELSGLRKNFPITEKAVYMNHGAISPCPSYVREAILKHLEDWSNMNPDFMSLVPYGGEGPGQGETSAVKQAFANLVKAKPNEIALVPNTNIGLNTIVHALRISRGKNIIMPEAAIEHPTYLPNLLEENGIETRYVERKNGRFLPDDVEKKVDKNTALIFMCHAEYGLGTRNDVKAMAEIAHRHGVRILIDAFQSVGALKVDVKALDVDFLSTGTYKWMLGIKGTGFLYVKDALIPELKPALFGWANGPYHDSYKKANKSWITGVHESASRFETGSSSIIGFVAAKAAIDFLLQIGMERIEKRLMDVTGYLIGKLQSLGVEIYSPLEPSARSGNVTFKFKNAPEVVQKIRKKGFWVSGGFHYLDGIRASPHFYNTEDEVDRLLKELKAYI